MAQGAGLVRDQDYSAPGTSWQAPGRPWCLRNMQTVVRSFVLKNRLFVGQLWYENGRPELDAQRLRTVVRSFVARDSTFCSTNVIRKRTSGVRCSYSCSTKTDVRSSVLSACERSSGARLLNNQPMSYKPLEPRQGEPRQPQ